MHIGGRIDDIDLDVRPVLGIAQPTQHPYILEKERRYYGVRVVRADEDLMGSSE